MKNILNLLVLSFLIIISFLNFANASNQTSLIYPNGYPSCSYTGRSDEGWYFYQLSNKYSPEDSQKTLIKLERCNGCIANMDFLGTKSEGWYSNCTGQLIKYGLDGICPDNFILKKFQFGSDPTIICFSNEKNCSVDYVCSIFGCISIQGENCLLNATNNLVLNNSDICEGCLLNQTCYDVGSQYVEKYCSSKKIWENKKEIEKSCKYDYECLSNRCVDKTCVLYKEKFSLGSILSTFAIILASIVIIIIPIYFLIRNKH